MADCREAQAVSENAQKDIDGLLDINKHLTTLSAGSLELITSFQKDIFPKHPGWLIGFLITGGFLCLILATTFAVITMTNLTSAGFG